MSDWMDTFNGQSVGVKIVLAVLVLALLGVVLLGGVFALGSIFFYDSYSSTYEYDASIYIDGPTETGVFLLPIPVHDGDVHLGEVHTTGSDRFVGIDHSIVDTAHGPMLLIEVEEIDDGRDALWVHAILEADQTIETRAPRNTEPILSPLEISEIEPEPGPLQDRRPDYHRFDATSTAFAAHDGPEDTEIGFIVWHDGTNSWWTFGWNWNQYDTTLSANEAARDPAGAWVELRGYHREGAGSYPRFPPAPS